MKKSILILGLLMLAVSSKAEIFIVDRASDCTNIQAAFGHVDAGCSANRDRLQDSRCTQKDTQKFVSMFNCPPTHIRK
ncbi:MAG: hypothetical protein ACYS91_04900 [Planctomycetota bacterium]|jgi:hypothetical protein